MSQEHEQELDKVGLATLERFSEAERFNSWMYASIRRHCKGRVLEIGSGIGNLSRQLLAHHDHVSLSDFQQHYCDRLKHTFRDHPHLDDVLQLDISKPDFRTAYPFTASRYDTVVALNVVEHIRNDRRAVRNCAGMLAADGHLIILVPAYPLLYNRLDKELGHFRRYTAHRLRRLLEDEGMKVVSKTYFNSAAIPGWIFSGAILKHKEISGTQLKIYNALVPVFRFVDTITRSFMGLSVIMVAKKQH